MIDAHQHFWRLGRNDCAWPTPDLAAIHRDYEPAELRALAEPFGVTGSILVQSQPSDRDTDYLLELAAHEPFVLGVVGWADLKAPGAAGRIAELAARPKLKGLRPMLQGLPADWILDPAVEPAIDAMTARGLVFEALVFPHHLPALRVFAEGHPGLNMVIDHCAKPSIASGDLGGWREEMAEIARRPQACCKVSGLLTEAGDRRIDADLAPVVDHVLGVFGPERVMWGSDWPVIDLAGSYAGWLGQARRLTDGLSAEDRDAVFERTAARVYSLQPPLA